MRPKIFDILFNDDRMFVIDITLGSSENISLSEPKMDLEAVTTRPDLSKHTSASSGPGKKKWVLTTRRNVSDYPPTRCDTFESRSEAVAYYKKVIVETPRVSLGHKPPAVIPTINEYRDWLITEKLFDPLLNPKVPLKKKVEKKKQS